MLLDKLYYLKEFTFDEEQRAINARVELNADHEIFEGHFPGKPILPGVCQVEMVSELVSKHYHKNYKLTMARQIKFLAMVSPLSAKELLFKIKVEGSTEGVQVNAVCSYTGGEVFLKLTGTFSV